MTSDSLMKLGIVIEKDEDKQYVALFPELTGHTQAKTLDHGTKRITEAIQVCSEVEGLKCKGRTKTRRCSID